jgi:hypothetical protein
MLEHLAEQQREQFPNLLASLDLQTVMQGELVERLREQCRDFFLIPVWHVAMPCRLAEQRLEGVLALLVSQRVEGVQQQQLASQPVEGVQQQQLVSQPVEEGQQQQLASQLVEQHFELLFREFLNKPFL